MSFQQQLIVSLVDKALVSALLLIVSLGLNRAIEKVRYVLGLDAKRREITLQSQIRYLET